MNSPSRHLEVVRQAARGLNLLDLDGRLIALDSLAIIDLVMALESAAGLSIPTASLRQELFETLETVAELLDQLAEDGG